MAESIWLANLIIYFILLLIFAVIVRFIFSIHSILRNQRITNHLLTGIATRLKVDSTYFNHSKV